MKPWQTPQLIVLVRNTPEEAVLTGCKLGSQGTTPTDEWPGCAHYYAPGACEGCNSLQLS